MLVVFCGVPVAAPSEAMGGKEAVAQVVFVDLVGEALAAVRIDFAAGRGNVIASVGVSVKDDVGVVVGVYVDSQPVGVLG